MRGNRTSGSVRGSRQAFHAHKYSERSVETVYSTKNMRILIIMGGFFPGKKFGGPPVSIDNFCSLMKEHDVYIVTVDHDLFETVSYSDIKSGWNKWNNCQVLYLPENEYNKSSFEKAINDIQPDILYLQGLFQKCVFPCLQLSGEKKTQVLLAPRGELCGGALNINKWKKLPYIKVLKMLGLVKNIHWQSTSDEETDAIKRLMGVNDGHIHRLDNVPSIPKREYPRRDKISGEGRFVFLSRIHPKKNLLSAIKYFKNIDGHAWFDIYGPIEDEEYWKKCQYEISVLSENVTVEYRGLVDHDRVHEVFSQYDAFLFPTFSENYGHVIAESLIVGTPVIISDQTPWRELEKAGAGWDIDLNKPKEFINAIKLIISFDKEQMSVQRIRTKEYIESILDIRTIHEKYEKVLREVFSSK